MLKYPGFLAVRLRGSEVNYLFSRRQFLAGTADLQTTQAGRWKLHFAKEQSFDPARLFDLDADRGESRDVAAEHPAVVRRLEKLAEGLRDDLGDASRNRTGHNVRPIGS